MDILVVIGTILSIIGGSIQILHKFQENKVIRDRVIFTVYGFTVGVFIGLLNKTEILIQEEITFAKVMMFIALVGFLILLFIFAIGYIKNTSKQSQETFLASIFLISIFVMFLVVGSCSRFTTDEYAKSGELGYSEYRILVDGLQKEGKYEKALEFLLKGWDELEEHDFRREKLKKTGLEIYNELLVSEGMEPVTEEELRDRYEQYWKSRQPRISILAEETEAAEILQKNAGYDVLEPESSRKQE